MSIPGGPRPRETRPFRLRPAGECPCAGRPGWCCRSAACARCQGGVLRRRWLDRDRHLPVAVRRLVKWLPVALLTTRISAGPVAVAALPAFLRRLGDGLRYSGVDATWFTAVERGERGCYHAHQVVLAGCTADLERVRALAGHTHDLFPAAAGPRQVVLVHYDLPFNRYRYACKIGHNDLSHIPPWLPTPRRCRWRVGYRACLRRLTARSGGALQ